MRVALSGGAYQARSVIAGAQVCINLYAEAIPQSEGEPAQFSYYPTPGLSLLHTLSAGGPVRGLYAASSGALYAVGGAQFWRLDNQSDGTLVETGLATLTTSTGQVSMCDNSETLILVDGSTKGYAVDLQSNAVTILDSGTPGFYGANRVDFLDTFFVFNKPGTPQFYVSGSLAATFDSLDFANKSGAPDQLVAVVAARGELWLFGQRTSEIWTDSGASDFPFQKLAGVLVEHGCDRVDSIAKADGQIYFLSHDLQGRGIVLKASGYQVTRISTHAIEHEINTYKTTDDAIGYCYQQEGHTFYVLSFPTADATWAYDEASGQWHQWIFSDQFGLQHRHRSNCFAAAFDTAVVGDWQNGNLYVLNLDNYTDNGQPIIRARAFPHSVKDGKRVSYSQFSADMECGAAGNDAGATVQLSWSDDRGATYGAPVSQAIGAAGLTTTQMKWSRLGLARDRVFLLSWSAPVRTALLGGWIDAMECET